MPTTDRNPDIIIVLKHEGIETVQRGKVLFAFWKDLKSLAYGAVSDGGAK